MSNGCLEMISYENREQHELFLDGAALSSQRRFLSKDEFY